MSKKTEKDNPGIGVRLGILEAEVKDHNGYLKGLTNKMDNLIGEVISLKKDTKFIKGGFKIFAIGIGCPIAVYIIIQILKELGLAL